jgi:YfiH family protein
LSVSDLIIAADWSAPAGIVAGCSTRNGGVSDGTCRSLNLGDHVGDDPQAVLENRRRLAAAGNLPDEPRWLQQVHGTDLIIEPETGDQGDAALSRTAGVVCTVMIADCLPVLICSADGTELAAAHAGWRGLAAGVLENTVAAFDSAPDRLLAWLGPAISQDAFEVGDEVRAAFTGRDSGAAEHFRRNEQGRWQADLFGLARLRLGAAGVRNIAGGGLCTYSEPERFFSYRRDGQCGRMCAYIYRVT